MRLNDMDRLLVELRSTRGRWLPLGTLAARAKTCPDTARWILDVLGERGLVRGDTTPRGGDRYLITQRGDDVAERLLKAAMPKARRKTPRTAWARILDDHEEDTP